MSNDLILGKILSSIKKIPHVKENISIQSQNVLNLILIDELVPGVSGVLSTIFGTLSMVDCSIYYSLNTKLSVLIGDIKVFYLSHILYDTTIDEFFYELKKQPSLFTFDDVSYKNLKFENSIKKSGNFRVLFSFKDKNIEKMVMKKNDVK